MNVLSRNTKGGLALAYIEKTGLLLYTFFEKEKGAA